MQLDAPATQKRGLGNEKALVLALLVQDGERLDWWRRQLAMSLAEIAAQQPIPITLRLHLLQWTSPLPEALDEVHVLGADALPDSVRDSLQQRPCLLTLHRWDAHAGGCAAHRWESERDLACYIEQLLLNLGGRVCFGLRWRDYCQHRTQPGNCFGHHVRSADWRELLPALGKLPGAPSSAILFLRVSKAFTLGNYVEFCNLLERQLPNRCLTTVSVQADAEQECSATLLLTIPPPGGRQVSHLRRHDICLKN